MRFQALVLFLGTALANPLFELQERQDTCAAQVGVCRATPTLLVRANNWCTSLGFGTVVRTARLTSTAQRTLITTTTLFTSTSTSVLPTFTSTVTSARTTTVTAKATRRITSYTTTITLRRTATFDSCPEYTLGLDSAVPDPTTTDAAPAPTVPGQKAKRQVATSVKPACVTAVGAAQTTAACQCLIPASTTTRTTTLRSTTTATRTIVSTRRMVSTVTSRPVATVTLTPLRTRTITVTTTSINRAKATETTTVAYELSATPTAFVLLDRVMASDAALAQWGVGDSDNATFNNLQYNTVRSDPTRFTFNEWNELQVNGEDDSDDIPVVGLEQDGDFVRLAAFEDGSDAQAAACIISVTPDGLCPVKCTVGDYAVNSQDGDADLWDLLSDGTDAFTNYLYAAEDGWDSRANK